MIYVYCDGAVEPRNPGGWAVGGFIVYRDDVELARGTHDLGWHDETTNNQAEHIAVQAGLRKVAELGLTELVTVRTDSQLVVNQLARRWGCSNPTLVAMRDETWALMEKHRLTVSFEWIPRAKNKEADAVSRSLYRGEMAPGMPEPEFKRPKRGRKER